MKGERIRVSGIVQGVGFRPTVWRLARALELVGRVWNDGQGVEIEVWGEAPNLAAFAQDLRTETPPLARIEAIRRQPLAAGLKAPATFEILASREGETRTGVAADAATCPACLAEVLDPANRRYRYPFTNCTHCGPRLSIIDAMPYDRANTSMASFPMCSCCEAEYLDPADRRFHAQPNACPDCGPQVWLEDAAGNRLQADEASDVIATAACLIREGRILAIKGIGGFHLACDAGNSAAVETLRTRKRRYAKAFALMARDLAMVARFTQLDEAEAGLLQAQAAPIVVLRTRGERLAPAVAPGQRTLGFMLPYTPLHHLLLQAMERPIVFTSGNRSDEPQTIANADAQRRLAQIADVYLLHDREILNRVDDSVLRLADGQPRFLRRARGYAPQPINLPDGIKGAASILAMGGELKNTFCLLQDGRAVLSQHMGDLEDATTYRDYRHNLRLFRRLYDFTPDCIVVDEHPDYLSTQLGRQLAANENVPLVEVQHHHAHIVSCMAEHGLAPGSGRVLGVALDGLGYGEDRTIWGGEFLLADYEGFERLAWFQPVPMLGGAQAMHQPWRNTFAQLHATLGWSSVLKEYAQLEIVRFLQTKPLETLASMAEKGLNSPPASSAGRLFDAVAAALGVCRESAGFEGQAAIELEALASDRFDQEAAAGYGFELRDRRLEWASLWRALLADIGRGIAPAVIAARFHQGVARAVAATAERLCTQHGLQLVVLSGGVFQNRLLLQRSADLLRDRGLAVLVPYQVPANDGGLSLGQAAIAAARLQQRPSG